MKKIIILMLLVSVNLCVKSVHAQDWKEYKKSHFIVYYKTAPLDFVENVEEMAEYYYADITKNLGFTRHKGWTWDERAKIYIFDDAEDFVNNGGHAHWSHGVASPKSKTIHTFPSAHGFFDSTLPHELGHIIFKEFVGYKTKIPRWFEEGVAMHQEKARRWGAHKYVRGQIENDNFIPLQKLTKTRLTHKSSRDLVDLFYAESASIVNYMITELGQQRFERFCRKLKDGKPFEWALESAYIRFRNIEKLNDTWVKYLQ